MNLVFIINVDWYFHLHWLDRAQYFKKQGYNIHVVTNFTDKNIKEVLLSMGFSCHEFSVKRKSLNLFQEVSSFYKLATLLKEIQPDLIHCITVKPNIYGGVINKWFLEKPIVYSITGLGAVYSSTSTKFTLLRRVITFLYRYVSVGSSRFIFENQDDHKLFTDENILKFRNGHLIKGAGIDISLFSPSLPPQNKSVLFASRLLKDKGLHKLVEAKEILRNDGIEFTLNVAGIVDTDVSSAIPIKQIHSWASEGFINWLGNVKEMPDLIKSNDIVCLPTTYGEGVPRILIEAASCQRAIVTTDVVGCREIVSHGVNGLLASPNDAISLANCLRALLESDEICKKYGVQGRKKVEEQFSQELVFEKTQCVYNELLGH